MTRAAVLLRLPPATDPWIRVLGVVVMVVGLLDVASARAEQTGFFHATARLGRFFASLYEHPDTG